MSPQGTREYSSTSAAIAGSSCDRLGLANWALVEYPLWVGLRDDKWHGEIQDVDVQNVSRRFENPAFKPCALLQQETAAYVGADDADVNLQFGSLALSIDPADARSLRFPVAGFHSSVAGVRVLPGEAGPWPEPREGHAWPSRVPFSCSAPFVAPSGCNSGAPRRRHPYRLW